MFGFLFKSAKEADSPEALEAKILADLEASQNETATLKAQVTELQNKLAQANSTVETAMANVVAERAKLAEEKSDFAAYVKEKSDWLNEPAAEPVKVKSGFQLDANGEKADASLSEIDKMAMRELGHKKD